MRGPGAQRPVSEANRSGTTARAARERSEHRLRADTGWEPGHDLVSMFEHTYEWYRRSGRAEADENRFDWSFEDALLRELG